MKPAKTKDRPFKGKFVPPETDKQKTRESGHKRFSHRAWVEGSSKALRKEESSPSFLGSPLSLSRGLPINAGPCGA